MPPAIVPASVPQYQPAPTPQDIRPATPPPSQYGLTGVIVPKATPGGIPSGTQPHDTSGIVVRIDPKGEDGGKRVPLQALSKTALDKATREVEREMGFTHGQAQDINQQRELAARVMERFSQMQTEEPTAPQTEPAPDAPPAPVVQQTAAPTVAPAQAPHVPAAAPNIGGGFQSISPLGAFSAASRQTPPAKSDTGVPNVSKVQGDPGPPLQLVTIEREHFGRMDAPYHDVIVRSGFVVLVYDTRHVGSIKYFPEPPPPGTVTPAMAIHIHGTTQVHQVHTTGVQYIHNDLEYCLLMVENTAELDGNAQPQ